jgi:hypothetical protein
VRLVILVFVGGGALPPDMGISCSARVHTAASVGGWSFWCSLLYVCLFLLVLIAIMLSCGVALVILMLAGPVAPSRPPDH